jgi:hypothetical protein
VPHDLKAAAKRARDFALTVNSAETRDAFSELARRWEQEAVKATQRDLVDNIERTIV